MVCFNIDNFWIFPKVSEHVDEVSIQLSSTLSSYQGKTDFEGMRSISVALCCTKRSVPTRPRSQTHPLHGPITTVTFVGYKGRAHPGLIRVLGDGLPSSSLSPFTYILHRQIQDYPRIGRNYQNPLLKCKAQQINK